MKRIRWAAKELKAVLKDAGEEGERLDLGLRIRSWWWVVTHPELAKEEPRGAVPGPDRSRSAVATALD